MGSTDAQREAAHCAEAIRDELTRQRTLLQTGFAQRPADACNSVVFLCLEASDAGRLLPAADAATLRCLQWLASGLPPVDRGVTVDAVRQNLRDGCGVAATEAQVAGWLSR